MTLSSPPAPVEARIDAAPAENATQSKRAFKLALAAVFILSLTCRVYFNFVATHTNCAFVGDASEYLREATALATPLFRTPEFLHNALAVLNGSAAKDVVALVHQQTGILNELKVSGPVFPLLIAACYAIANTTPSEYQWTIPVAAQCILSSFTCLLISLTAARAWNRKVGIMAGAVAALYPSFIISSGSLYNETFTTFLYTAMALLTVSSLTVRPVSNWACYLLGLASAALQLTRPPAVILSLLTFPFVSWQRSKKSIVSGILSLLLGFATIFTPYLVFQKVVFNTASLIVNRRASENLFMGNSPETQGWISMPFVWMPEENKRTAYVINQSLKNPRQTLQLFIDKVIRLTKFPYNDQRLAIGALVFPEQVLFHQFILIFAAIGLTLAMFTEAITSAQTQLATQKRKARTALLIIAGSNLVYVAFVAMARYFYPAMPIVIMFASAGFFGLIGSLRLKSAPMAATCTAAICAVLISAQINYAVLLLRTGVTSNILLAQGVDFTLKLLPLACLATIIFLLLRDTTAGARKMATAIGVLLLAIAVPAICLPSRANGRTLETVIFMSHPGQTIHQVISLPPDLQNQLKGREAYLMLDVKSERSLDGLSLRVNGKHIQPRYIPGLSMVQDFGSYGQKRDSAYIWEYENILQCMTAPARISNADLRQWYLLPLDVSALASSGQLVVEISKTNYSTTVLYGQFARNKQDLSIPSPSAQSSEKAFCCVESPISFGDPRFDTRVKLAPQTGAASLENDAAFIPKGVIPNIRLLLTAKGTKPESMMAAVPFTSTSLPEQQVEEEKDGSIVIQPQLPTLAKGSILLMHFHGQIKALRGSPLPHLEVQVFSNKQGSITGYSSPWTPAVIKAENSWREFSFTLPVAVTDLPGEFQAIHIVSTNGDPHWQLLHKARSNAAYGIKDFGLELSAIPKRPVAAGYTVY